MSKIGNKFLQCDCCAFLAVIPENDNEKDIGCPFCKKAQCSHGGRFVVITMAEFCREAEIPVSSGVVR